MTIFSKLIQTASIAPLLLAIGCGGGSSGERPNSVNPSEEGNMTLANLYTYQNLSISENVLVCAKLNLSSGSCNLADIRPIGANVVSTDITLDDIKSRLVISHDWMAESFIDALEEINDQDLLNLFKAVNTIVISSDIRPSFYDSKTASIYLDARYLWRNSVEWKTIFEQDDFRKEYQNEFSFDAFLRYVDQSTKAYTLWSNTYNEDSYNNRTTAQLSPGLFRLLAHELAHANDFITTEILNNLGSNGEIYSNYIYPADDINDELAVAFPLTSDLLFEAAQVAYRGSDMTSQIRNTTASIAGDEFDGDGAADLYGYSTHAEDVAMLFEAFMMYKKYGAISDVAFVTVPSSEEHSCDEYVVKWGQSNRLADANVKQRAIFVANKILGRDITLEFSSLSGVTDMETDIGWCSSRFTTSKDRSASMSSRLGTQVVHDYMDDRIRD